jgi:hypothetical protein
MQSGREYVLGMARGRYFKQSLQKKDDLVTYQHRVIAHDSSHDRSNAYDKK